MEGARVEHPPPTPPHGGGGFGPPRKSSNPKQQQQPSYRSQYRRGRSKSLYLERKGGRDRNAKARPDEFDTFQDKAKEMPPIIRPTPHRTELDTNKGSSKDKLKYDRSFLLEFQKSDLALKRPESLPNLEVVLDAPNTTRSYERPPKMNTDFTPGYLMTPGRSRGPMQFVPQNKQYPGRNSQSGKRPPKIIEFSPSNTGGSLKTTENAWKPHSKSKDISDDEQAKIEKIVKKVRGILNKLTPDNFNKLVTRVKEISFDNLNQFDEVITLVFEKAVSEQSFSSMYAELCQVLSGMSVKYITSDQGKDKSDAKFKNLIISKCQQEFERENSENTELAKLAEELNQCADPIKKEELRVNYDFEETKLRKKSVGNVRFIGELYKLKMLTSPIMMRIIGSLLHKKDEESLECLCKLLQTIGKNLELSALSSTKAQTELNKHFKTMQDLVESRATSSRVRFLMMNVIDMRRNDWVPRREDAKPKTKAQVHEDIKKEEEEAAHILNTTVRRGDDRERKRSRDNRMDVRMDDWTMVNNNQRRLAFDSARLMGISGRVHGGHEEQLLRPNTMNMWGSGSSGGIKEPIGARDNRFSPLEEGGYQEPRRPMNVGPRLAPGGNMGGNHSFNRHAGYGSKSMPAPSEKPNQFNRNMHSTEHSKSSSRSSSRDSSLQRETKTPPIIAPMTPPAPMEYEDAQKHTIAIVDEYISIRDRKEAKTCIEEKFNKENLHFFVQAAFEHVLDKNPEKRKLVGQLLQYLLSSGLVSSVNIVNGCKPVLEFIEDLSIDIPQVAIYVGEILAPLLVDSAFTLQKMEEIFELSESKKAELMANLVIVASKSMGSNKVSELWKESDLDWSRLLPSSGPSIEDFISKHNLDFLGTSSIEKIQNTLYKMFQDDVSLDSIFAWVESNVEDAKNKKFVRALVTALVESQAKTSSDGSIEFGDSFEGNLKNKLSVISKYTDNQEQLELECAFALQAISTKYQHPPGLIEKCFNAFYDTEVVCEETFFVWMKSKNPEEQNGKGVCVKSLHKFFKWLEEADTEEGDPVP